MNAMVTQQPQLVRYEAACKALAEAKAVDEVQSIRIKADAMRIYAMQAKNKTLEIDAAEIRIRAERRLGELLLEQKHGDGFNTGSRAQLAGREVGGKVLAVGTSDRQKVPTLAEAGISKDLSARAQKIASVPAEVFEWELDDWRDRVKDENARVTTRLEAAGERAISAKAAAEPESSDTIETLRSQLAAARENAQELTDLLEGYGYMEQGQHASAKEIARLKGLIRTIEVQRDTCMTTCNTLKREVKALQRKLDAKP